MKKFLVPIIALIFGVNSISSQVVVSAKLDSISMLIGEQSNLSIQATQPADHVLQFPIFSDTIAEGLDVVSSSTPDTVVLDDGSLQVTTNYMVTAFDSALIYMPGFKVIDGKDTFVTNPLSIKIIDMPVDTTQQAITDIKGLYEPPFDWAGLFTIIGYVVLGVLAVLLICYIVYVFIKNKKVKEEEPEIIVDPRSAHEIAIEALTDLRNKKLWENNRFKEYYTVLTEIVRLYIYRRYGIGAMEQTSDDLLYEFRNNAELKEKKEETRLLAEILQVADLVKFAKFVPLPPDCERSMTQAETFVERTKMAEEVDNQTSGK